MEMNDTEAKTTAQAEMLANRLRKRLSHLRKWAKRLNIGAFRLYDRDIPEIPLVLDMYGDAVSGALYKRPYEKDEREEARWIEAMRSAIAMSLSLEQSNVIIKQREKQRGQSQYEKISGSSLTRIISEGDARFKVNLSDYLDTGLFLDRRSMRRMVNADSPGKRVLNLFCYTGSFSVHAAAGGAVSVDSADLSNTYLNWARENFSLNGFPSEILRLEEYFTKYNTNVIQESNTLCNTECITPCMTKSHTRNRLIRADVNAFLREAANSRCRWDSIIIDPPAFSNSSMARADFDLNRDYGELLARSLSLLAPEGKLWFSASARSFKAGAADMEAVLKTRFPHIKVIDISNQTIDEDFKKKTPKTSLVISN